MSQTQKIFEKNGRKITLIGTAHISKESIEEVKNTICEIKPDSVAVELDEKRADSIKNPEKYRELDIIKVLRKNEGFLLLANLVMASFQKRMGSNVGINPGEEMICAMNTANELGIPVHLVDRPVQTTFKRAWAKSSGSGKVNLLSALFASSFSNEKISQEEVENLKKSSEMDSMMNELAEAMPAVKQVLIDERDEFIACRIWNCPGSNTVAVIGAGHMEGVFAQLERIASGEKNADTTEIEKVPPKKLTSKIAVWLIPAVIIALIAYGFYLGGKDVGQKMVLGWILWNGILSALGAIIAGAHPLTVLVSFVGAPVTSLCPFIGVGFVAGAVQALVKKPQVRDLEKLSDEAGSIKGFYHNKLLRVLLVFVLSSLGSSAGTFIAGAGIVVNFSALISRIFSGLK